MFQISSSACFQLYITAFECRNKSTGFSQDLVYPEAERQINNQLVPVMTFSLRAYHYIPKQLPLGIILRAFITTISQQGHSNSTNVKLVPSGAMTSHSSQKSHWTHFPKFLNSSTSDKIHLPAILMVHSEKVLHYPLIRASWIKIKLFLLFPRAPELYPTQAWKLDPTWLKMMLELETSLWEKWTFLGLFLPSRLLKCLLSQSPEVEVKVPLAENTPNSLFSCQFVFSQNNSYFLRWIF